MRGKRTDSNQQEIVKALRKIPGVSVAITSSLGEGFTDLVIGYKNNNFLIEVKDGNKPPSARKLTPDEQQFKDRWKGQYDVCNSLDEILKIINVCNS